MQSGTLHYPTLSSRLRVTVHMFGWVCVYVYRADAPILGHLWEHTLADTAMFG